MGERNDLIQFLFVDMEAVRELSEMIEEIADDGDKASARRLILLDAIKARAATADERLNRLADLETAEFRARQAVAEIERESKCDVVSIAKRKRASK